MNPSATPSLPALRLTQFRTLLQREWMQHGRGWLIVCGVPLIMILLSLSFGGVQMNGNESPSVVALLMLGGYTLAVTLLGWVSVAFQASSLARRDHQDRSIEFWRSLPVSDWASVGATVLMSFLLMPLMVLGIASVSAILVALLVVARLFGVGAVLDLPWQALGLAVAVGLPRLILGVVLASLWAAPLLLLGMAASAWLKRWGLPALALVLGVGGVILDKAYGFPWLLEVVRQQSTNFVTAMIPGTRRDGAFETQPFPGGQLDKLPGWLIHDGLSALGDLASPMFLLALAVSVASFTLLVYKRRAN